MPSPPSGAAKSKKEEVAPPVTDIPAVPVTQKGHFTFPDTDQRYDGEFIEVEIPSSAPDATPEKKRQRHGKGVFRGNGEEYDGEWSHDVIEGTGTFTFADGAKYSGTFHGGRYDGRGKMVWADLSYYDGDWTDGKMHGRGVFRDTRGQSWTGIFHNDTFRNETGFWIPANQQNIAAV